MYVGTCVPGRKGIAVFPEKVPLFSLRDFAIFDGLCRAVLNARHAVGTGLLCPDGFSILYPDGIYRTELFALSAGNALIGYMETACSLTRTAPYWIEDQGYWRFKKPDMPLP